MSNNKRGPNPTEPAALLAFILANCEPNGDCLVWQGYTNPKGYGVMRALGKRWILSRLVGTLIHGELPDSVFVCHHCDNPPCLKPDHLFLGTNADNLRDMTSKDRHGRANSRKTHCPRGHEYTPENVRLRPSRPGERSCRACERIYNATKRAKSRGLAS